LEWGKAHREEVTAREKDGGEYVAIVSLTQLYNYFFLMLYNIHI
jgi:hypothetical protein